ncbi:FAD-dependent oxidoreductase [Myxococcota bacterium]|nr:FAD-dependent oxidoreductase [Myxococcota bacterium]
MACVVVAGAGLAGLACAWRLQRAGHEVEVLERAPALAGRHERYGFVLDDEPPLPGEATADLERMLEPLRRASALRPLARRDTAVVSGGQLQPQTSPAELLGSRRFSPRSWLALASGVRRRRPGGRRADESLAEFTRREFGGEVLEAAVAPWCEGGVGCTPEQISRDFALALLRDQIRPGPWFSLVGGAAALREALAGEVPVRWGCELLALESQSDGVRMRVRSGAREHRIFGDAAVIALPAGAVPRVCPKLSPGEAGFFANRVELPGVTVFLMLDRPPRSLRTHRVLVPRSLNLTVGSVTSQHHRSGATPDGAGLLAVRLASRQVSTLSGEPDALVVDAVLASLARTPIGRLDVQATAVLRRTRAHPVFPVGHAMSLARFNGRLDPSPRLSFAGDYLVKPGVAGKIASGMRAATRIAQELSGVEAP